MFINFWGTWVAQLVKGPTSAQVMISRFTVCGFEPRVGLCADSSEPGAYFGFCVSLSLRLSHLHSVSLCLSKINVKKKTTLNVYSLLRERGR